MTPWFRTHGPHLAGFLLLTALAVGGVAYLQRPGPPSPPQHGPVVAFGDSLVEGVGASLGHDWPSLLSQRLGIEIVNRGHTGDLTADAYERLDRDVLSLQPRVVVVLIGGNDIIRLIPREDMFANIGTIVRRITRTGARVVLLGLRCGLVADECASGFAELGEDPQVSLVPAALDGITGRPGLLSDPLHPNDEGYARLADKVEPVLREVLLELE